MSSFKFVVPFLLVAAARIEASLVPHLAHAVAAPIAYTKAVPFNVPPFASSVSIYGKTLGLPFAAYSAPLLQKAVLPAAPFAYPYAAPAPFAAAPLAPAPLPFAAAPVAPAPLPLAAAPAPLPFAPAPLPLAAGPFGPAPALPLAAKALPAFGVAPW